MKRANILFYSLLGALVSVPHSADAAIRVGNPSRNNAAAYQQLNEIRGLTPNGTVSVTKDLPIPVESNAVAELVKSGSENAPVTMSELERCSMIYPSGKFEWVSPTFGPSAGSPATCTAVVEMRTRENTLDGAEIVLARANVAAGDAVLCNISAFPEFSILDAAGTVTFPADNPPTRAEVVRQMDEEQKGNAVVKIVSSALVGALGGNAMGQNKDGQDGIFGTSKRNWVGTAIGGLGGAGIGAAGAYGGKVGGDIAMSVGMNTMAGAITGNMMSTGDSVLYIADCTAPIDDSDTNQTSSTDGSDTSNTKKKGQTRKCLYGTLDEFTPLNENDVIFYRFGDDSGAVYKCSDTADDGVTYHTCEPMFNLNYHNAKLDCGNGCYDQKNPRTSKDWIWEDIIKDNFRQANTSSYIYRFKENCVVGRENKPNCLEKSNDDMGDKTNKWVKVKNARPISKRENVVIYNIGTILDTVTSDGKQADRGGAFGYSQKRYSNQIEGVLQSKWVAGELKVYIRNGATLGLCNHCVKSDNFNAFTPLYMDSETGAVIDLSNRARLKDTVVGAAAGGALGAFSAYQGAQTEIEDRLNAERRAYKDSLGKFYCTTGDRFLSFYNEEVVIPVMTPVTTDETK